MSDQPSTPQPDQPNPETGVEDSSVSDNKPDVEPTRVMEGLRKKMKAIAKEFSEGKINRAQFNAIYGRYSEQRAIIARLTERNPDSPAWQQVAKPGHTGFLRNHFQSQPLYFLIYKRGDTTPLMAGGDESPESDYPRIQKLLATLWKMSDQRKAGVARMSYGNNRWLILALGEKTVSVVMFNLEPSLAQINLVRDLHADFERANYFALERNLSPGRMVFPQRALIES